MVVASTVRGGMQAEALERGHFESKPSGAVDLV